MTDEQVTADIRASLAAAEAMQRNTEQREHASWPVIVSGGVVVWLLAMALFNIPIWGN